MAEAVLAAEAKRRPNLDLKIDSAGTGAYHTGEPADSRYVLRSEGGDRAACWSKGAP